MLETSENFIMKDLLGLELEQVCFGRFQVILRFEADASIAWNLDSRRNNKSSELVDLLGSRIKEINIDENNNLCVKLEDNVSVEFPKNDLGYESFEIWKGDQFLIG